MDESDLDYFRTVLEEKIWEAEDELQRMGDATDPISPDVAIGRLSRLDAMQMQQMSLDQRRRLQSHTHRLKKAMERIDIKKYGLCSSCRQEIEFARLQAQPEVMTCSRCAQNYGKEA